MDNLREAWQKIIFSNNLSEKKVILNAYWRLFADKLAKTLFLIDCHLEDAVIINEGGKYCLVYLINIDDFFSVYVGYLPIAQGPFLYEMPEDIATFYKTVHNGWYEKISGGLGFLPLQDAKWLSAQEWGILEDITMPDLDLERVFYIFHNASTEYLCINVTNRKSPEYLIIWSDKTPKLGIDFWSFIDSWIHIGLTN